MRHAVNLNFRIRHNRLLYAARPGFWLSAAKKAGGLHKLWHCAGKRETARCEHGINLPGHLLCGDHRGYRFHCPESGVARPARVNFSARAGFPACVWSSPARPPIGPIHLHQLFANAAITLTPMRDLRVGPDDYKQLAARCLELASESSASTVAEALRALALDYLTRAAKLRRREPIKSRLGRRRTGRPNRLAG
jgi:hypothetical protein